MDHSVDEHIDVVQRSNRALRTIVKTLRKKVVRIEQHSDEVFQTLCDADKRAELAFGKLWERGGFTCSPEDYDFIVERCLVALSGYNASHKSPTPVAAEPFDYEWQQP